MIKNNKQLSRFHIVKYNLDFIMASKTVEKTNDEIRTLNNCNLNNIRHFNGISHKLSRTS